jgi:hypothetical protein
MEASMTIVSMPSTCTGKVIWVTQQAEASRILIPPGVATRTAFEVVTTTSAPPSTTERGTIVVTVTPTAIVVSKLQYSNSVDTQPPGCSELYVAEKYMAKLNI